MTEPDEKSKGGRPRLDFSNDVVEALAFKGATLDDMAIKLGCSLSTIKTRKKEDPEFLAAIKRGESVRRLNLRDLQWDQAKKGNTTMLIWLGKNELGQSDRQLIGEDPNNPFKSLQEETEIAIQKILITLDNVEPGKVIDNHEELELLTTNLEEGDE